MACVSAACAWPRSLGIAANSGPRYTRWALPLNLSEVYVLMDALAAYERGCSRFDPHGRTARRIAGMIKRELSGYAKEKLGSRLEGMGFVQLEEVDPMFVPDIPGDKVPEGRSSQVANWLLYEKAGRWARVCLAGGGSVQGIILPRAELGRFFASRPQAARDDAAQADSRPSVSSGEAMMTTTLLTGQMSWM